MSAILHSTGTNGFTSLPKNTQTFSLFFLSPPLRVYLPLFLSFSTCIFSCLFSSCSTCTFLFFFLSIFLFLLVHIFLSIFHVFHMYFSLLLFPHFPRFLRASSPLPLFLRAFPRGIRISRQRVFRSRRTMKMASLPNASIVRLMASKANYGRLSFSGVEQIETLVTSR